MWNSVKSLFKKKKKKPEGLFGTDITWKHIMIACAVLVLSSFVFEFMRIYQVEAAKRSAIILQGMPPECSPDDMTILQSTKAFFSYHLSWNHNPCEKYQRAVMVDPIWEVTPLMVVSSSVTRCLLNPLEQLASTAGSCFSLFFENIPALWQPIILILTIVLVIILGLIKGGYGIYIPLILKIEPANKQQPTQQNQQIIIVGSKSKKSAWKRMTSWFKGSESYDNEVKAVKGDAKDISPNGKQKAIKGL